MLPKCPKLENVILVRDQTGGQYTPVPRELGSNVLLSVYDHLRQPGARPEADKRSLSQQSVNDPSDIACIMYTSGSTGVPKGVQLSHWNLIASLKAFRALTRQIDYSDDSTFIAFLPLAHILEFESEMMTWRKDLVKLQNGEFISLGKIETELKGCPLVENICIAADPSHKFSVALVIVNKLALDNLLKSKKLSSEVKLDPVQVNRLVYEAMSAFAVSKKLQKIEIPAKIKLCNEQWTPANGLVTAALKVRRRQVHDFYKEDILKLYAE
ncbi:Long-chain-fatty-acid--CoA ligase 3 [Halotydeus destructor]|nr:Long-chain-fatty-acid--CoA ligase 3 [Halotydeus destructor]